MLKRGVRPRAAEGGTMTIKSLKSTFFAGLILGPVTAGAKAAECDGAITAMRL
jgi:hypothetical protein